MTLSDISPAVSVAALVISLFTLWFTAFRRGTICSTHPSFIAFRYDFVGKEVPQAKIFFRALLFSTSKRGQVVESLWLRVSEGSRRAEFSFWGLGDKDLMRGSCLFVPETGIATNHHFNPIDSEVLFPFSGGSYSVELVAKIVGESRSQSLWTVTVEMPEDVWGSRIDRETAVFYSWSAEQLCYVMSIEKRPLSF